MRFVCLFGNNIFLYQVEVKRTVPREDMEVKGIMKTKKIFVGGLPASLTNGVVVEPFFFILCCNVIKLLSPFDYMVKHCR